MNRLRVIRCSKCGTPLRRDGGHLNGDDSPFCDLNELLRQIRDSAAAATTRDAMKGRP